MENKDNTGGAAPPLKRPGRKRKALAELPTGSNTNSASAPPRASKPRTRSVAREEAGAEEAKKRREADEEARMADVARLLDSKQPDAGAAQAAVVPYLGDIDRYLRSLEVEPLRRPRDDYIGAVQKDINAKMRGILVDWLVDVAEEFKLLADTHYLAVSYVDRFLTLGVISRDKLQLLGVAALLVAAKYEEINPPKVNKFSVITDGTYTKQQVVEMEADILEFLNFEMGSPTIRTFLRIFITACRGGNLASTKKLEFMCSYLAELSLLDYDCIRFLPSVVAAACLFVARFTISPKTRPWNLTLQGNTGYKFSDLKSCILTIRDLQLSRKCPDLKATRNKYEDRKFGCVSAMASQEEIPASFLKDVNKRKA